MKILFISLGCDKNLVDSEMMLGMLAERGHEFTDDENEAEAVVVNTCCFIGDAKEESINTLLQMAELKKEGSLKVLIAAGCLAQRYRDEVMEEIPEVDAILGTMTIDRICEAIDAAQSTSDDHKSYVSEPNDAIVYGKARSVTTGGYYAYLKIAEGCERYCSYCVIPSVRGKYRSVPMEVLLSDAERLVAGGAKELILVAQETTLYGTDLYGRKAFPELLHKLCQIEDLRWIRLLYCYPEEIDEDLITCIASEPKILKYLDIPIQHASDKILRRMGRRTDNASLRRVIERLREVIPDICLRTTLISGFPGETQEDHEILYNFVDEMEFDRLGVFTYSREEGTPAAVMADQVPEDIAAARRDELMELQQEIALEKAEERIGSLYDVLIEGYIPEDHTYVGRTYMDAPGVDGLIFVEADREFMSGDIIPVRVTASADYDLIGVLEDEFTE